MPITDNYILVKNHLELHAWNALSMY